MNLFKLYKSLLRESGPQPDVLNPQEMKQLSQIYIKLSDHINFTDGLMNMVMKLEDMADAGRSVRLRSLGPAGKEAFAEFFEKVSFQGKAVLSANELQTLRSIEQKCRQFFNFPASVPQI